MSDGLSGWVSHTQLVPWQAEHAMLTSIENLAGPESNRASGIPAGLQESNPTAAFSQKKTRRGFLRTGHIRKSLATMPNLG
jgi:hypothetical protein